MKSFIVFLSVLVFGYFAMPLQAQDHKAHHPEKEQTAKTNEDAGMGMMHGGMSGDKGMMQKGNMCGEGMKGKMHMKKGKMMKGMMGMNSPFHQSMHIVYHLADWQAQLNLSDTQAGQLKALRAEFEKQQTDRQAVLDKNEKEIATLLNDKADAGAVKNLLKDYYSVQTDIQLAAYKTARKMQSLLTTDQRQKLEKDMPGCDMMKDGM